MDEISRAFARHYGEKIAEHGPTARGLDWGSEADVRLRYRNMLEIIRPEDRRAVMSGEGPADLVHERSCFRHRGSAPVGAGMAQTDRPINRSAR